MRVWVIQRYLGVRNMSLTGNRIMAKRGENCTNLALKYQNFALCAHIILKIFHLIYVLSTFVIKLFLSNYLTSEKLDFGSLHDLYWVNFITKT